MLTGGQKPLNCEMKPYGRKHKKCKIGRRGFDFCHTWKKSNKRERRNVEKELKKELKNETIRTEEGED